MLEIFVSSPEFPAALMSFLVWHTLKATVILGAAYLTVTVCGRAAPVYRDMVLRVSVIAALALPGLSLAMPEWSFTFPIPLARAFSAHAGVSQSAVAVSRVPIGQEAMAGLAAWVVLLWLAGTSLILLRTGFGLLSTMMVARRARPADDGRAHRMMHELRNRLGIRRPVRLLVSTAIGVPFTWGILKPVIILPDHSSRWHKRDIRFALHHELAHIRRWDALWLVVVSLAAAIYWVNPLIWIARKRLMIESEKTCDDCVVGPGIDRTAYAEHLLATLRSMKVRRGFEPLGVGMARSSHMEGRLMSIMSERKRLTLATRPLVSVITILAMLLVLPLAGMQPNAAGDDKKPEAGETDKETLPGPDDFVACEQTPVMTYQQAPVYPEVAKKEKIEGVVWIKALVDKNGEVHKAMVGKSSGHEALDESALKAAYLNKYKPARLDDQPIAVWVSYKVAFQLDEKKDKSSGG